MRVLLTGSRAYPGPSPIYRALGAVLFRHGPFTLAHGACSTGADFYAHEWATAHPEVEEIKYPASWEAYGEAAGPMRDEHMVSDGADLCLAFPMSKDEDTQHLMGLARAAGIPVRTYNENGSLRDTRWSLIRTEPHAPGS